MIMAMLQRMMSVMRRELMEIHTGDDDRVSETKSTLDARIRHVQQVETEFDMSNNLKTEAGWGECRYLTCSTV